MHFQEINEILAKAIKIENMSADHANEITNADDYLLMKSENKPEWMDGFLESNRCKLVETICRATSVKKGISSIQGYSEGYFNEIIQNANDLHYGKAIDLQVSKAGNICKMICAYKDHGFKLSNIYAFLNREMSDKVDDDSLTGKFGVGIKSFFKFVSNLRIESNVIFDFKILRSDGDSSVSGTTTINRKWKKDTTSLMIEYDSSLIGEFNTQKLTDLIEYLEGNERFDPLRFFITGEDNEVVFDIRSLIFMRLKSGTKPTISKLKFSGLGNTVEMWCEEVRPAVGIKYDDESWNTGIVKLYIAVNGDGSYEKTYLYFTNENFSTAVPVGDQPAVKNRMYSTYYLKEDVQEKILPSGTLYDTSYANIYRNDVGDSEEAINRVYDKVRTYTKKLFEVMCCDEVTKLDFSDSISDVFHRFIALYYVVDRKEYPESPFNMEYCNNALLPKVRGELPRSYIVEHKETEEYENASFKEGNIVRELKESYFDLIENKEVYDLQDMLNNDNCIEGVRDALRRIIEEKNDVPEENRRIALTILNFFPTVGDFIAYKVSGYRRDSKLCVSDYEIDSWLINLRSKLGKYFDAAIFLKLIGRYKLNNAISYDGTVVESNLSFKDYLFNGLLAEEDGILSGYQNRRFDEKYAALKDGLLQQRYSDPENKQNEFMIRCIRPKGNSLSGWDGTYDYYQMVPPTKTGDPIPDMDLLLERIAVDPTFTGIWQEGEVLKLFEKYPRGMWKRERGFKYSTIDHQQIIKLSCLQDLRLDSFVKFVKAIENRALLCEEMQKVINISCVETEISTLDITNAVLPVMVNMPDSENKKYILDEYSPDNVQILKITENSNNEIQKEFSEFIFKMTGFRVHIYRFESDDRKKKLAYFGNGVCSVKIGSTRNFREAGKYLSTDKNVYIFYDNYSRNLQDLVIEVLQEFGLEAKRLDLMEGYISNGNSTKTMNYMSRRRNLAKTKRKLILDWARDINYQDIGDISDNEIAYRLLTARGSYDIFCPICSDVPIETFDHGEDTKKRHSRRIILMENSDPSTSDEIPYIITVACSYCCERLRSTLSKAEFDGRNLILTTQIAHGMHEKMVHKHQIEMSPLNAALMKNFKI